MTPAFDNPYLAQRLRIELESWLGTPFRHFCRQKGRGADCALFACQALVNARFVREVQQAYYSRDWHEMTTQEMWLENVQRHMSDLLMPGFIAQRHDAPAEMRFGDWCGFSLSPTGVTNHSGIYFGNGRLIHCINKRGVVIDPIEKIIDPWGSLASRFRVLFRIYVDA